MITNYRQNLFIQRDKYCDSLVWYANVVPPDDNRKYEFIGTKRDFKIWFTDVEGNEIKPDNFKEVYNKWLNREIKSNAAIRELNISEYAFYKFVREENANG